MKILLVAATQAEVEPILQACNKHGSAAYVLPGNHEVTVAVTGAGMVATAFTLGRQLITGKYELAVNAGIAGSFDFEPALGEVVLVEQDSFAELGAEDGDNFLPFDEMGFGDTLYQATAPAYAFSAGLRRVKAITVNKVHGNEYSIAKTLARFGPQTESMEGAAFYYACRQMNIPAIQYRAISNYVERRNKEKWETGLAIKNLNSFLTSYFEQLKADTINQPE